MADEEWHEAHTRMERLVAQLQRTLRGLEESQLAELVELFRNPRRMLFLSFYSGLVRGVGLAVGFTAIGAVFLYVLGRLASLHLPLIGRFIAEIARIVQVELKVH
ncbi:MAG TPA: DUF5665 domain-containing protein [Limnochordia bacterium]|nr:DUF5665 domain-containing protein [Limnochordia bacterium]